MPDLSGEQIADLRLLQQACERFSADSYEEDSDLLFGDEVLDANLSDFSLATAFLLGTHLRRMCTSEEVTLVMRFFDAIAETKSAWTVFVRARAIGDETEKEERARAQLQAFHDGFDLVSHY